MEPKSQNKRLRLNLFGAVQGVGFRPFVFILANAQHLTGWVKNSKRGVLIEAEGPETQLWEFRKAVLENLPPHAVIHTHEHVILPPLGYQKFEIKKSRTKGNPQVWIMPDLATCPACLKELFNPDNRRYRYPFINCTHCGPRYSIIRKTPYDRPNTSMQSFKMCPDCQTEYDDPGDRRFHAQPNACPECGPMVELTDNQGTRISDQHALKDAVRKIEQGKILAIKGLGGFHLIVDAQNEQAVRKLRNRKQRTQKPLALMFPDLKAVRSVCETTEMEERWIASSRAPILILPKKKKQTQIPDIIAPDNPFLGIMLPYTPLHHILMRDLDRPVVATSGNLSEEPICIDNREALDRLGMIADFYIMHNRPILRPVDDSIGRMIHYREMVLRRARGYAPLPVMTGTALPAALAVGGQLKNSIALSKDNQVILSQHIGDMETEPAYRHFIAVQEDCKQLFTIKPEKIIHDLHPGYLATQYALNSATETSGVQHHIAHLYACMMENELVPPVLGIAWDGTGYGPDETVWGGEFFKIEKEACTRAARFKHFPLPGGEAAIREPRRTALGLLYAMDPDLITNSPVGLPFQKTELKNLIRICENRTFAPLTSSAGRLFDAVAALLNLRHFNHYEGQAAMQLEFLASSSDADAHYPWSLDESESPWSIDWQPMISALLQDIADEKPEPVIARMFHNTLSGLCVEIVKKCQIQKIVLSGGCFQNKLLLELTIDQLQNAGFEPFWHQRIPPNDGGIAAGQLAALIYENRIS